VAKIEMRNVGHRYPGSGQTEYALKPLQLEWEDGGAYALLGPSGCGKTTLLNIISGLLTPSEGQVLFDRQDVTDLSPQQRNIAQVFQFPVVYDNMTVAENLEFPLKNRKVPPTERRERVQEVLDLLEMSAVAHVRARNLSADSKQKISLGRGLVRKDANALLFDEPLTVIDPALKWELRAQLKRVHQEVGHTMIYVTHDQTEALTFADKVVVMLEGEILQIGTPQDLFETPTHTFVGRFIGSPGMNTLDCEVSGSTAFIGTNPVPLASSYPAMSGRLELGVRPEHVDLYERESRPDGLPVTVTGINDLGREKLVHLQLAGQDLVVVLNEEDAIPSSPAAVLRRDCIHIYRDDVRVPPSGLE
jgi:glycerol transport system ATP-binding protein